MKKKLCKYYMLIWIMCEAIYNVYLPLSPLIPTK